MQKNDNIEHLLLIKNIFKKLLSNLGIEENDLTLIRCIYKKFSFNLIPTIVPFWKIRKKVRILSLSTYIQQRSGGRRQCNKTKIINKRRNIVEKNKNFSLQML